MGAAFAFFGGGVQVEKVMIWQHTSVPAAAGDTFLHIQISQQAVMPAVLQGPVSNADGVSRCCVPACCFAFGADRHIVGSTRTAHCASSHNRFGGFGYFVWCNVPACACARIIKRLNALKIIR